MSFSCVEVSITFLSSTSLLLVSFHVGAGVLKLIRLRHPCTSAVSARVESVLEPCGDWGSNCQRARGNNSCDSITGPARVAEFTVFAPFPRLD